eukprot:NODE_22553_length_703_cov_10.263889.p2 GENE.NODE_22553_length_703_cov_10.263889~~NODE_22553_length_703_cov_10.263889.p2  ORF type:complete len:125 (+),score=30.85 NODE_22553_length_703_cov_10.263889:39-413(+)
MATCAKARDEAAVPRQSPCCGDVHKSGLWCRKCMAESLLKAGKLVDGALVITDETPLTAWNELNPDLALKERDVIIEVMLDGLTQNLSDLLDNMEGAIGVAKEVCLIRARSAPPPTGGTRFVEL